jgi:hypothetical protein
MQKAPYTTSQPSDFMDVTCPSRKGAHAMTSKILDDKGKIVEAAKA